MPDKPLKPCAIRGCSRPAVVMGRCLEHNRERRHQLDQGRPSASERGYGKAWRVIRAEFLAAHPVCIRCGGEATEVDHIVPKVQGGTDDWNNLQAFCKSHHTGKTWLQSVRRGG
jgi:5-methylcytosine-specific restriction protein A